MTAPLREEASLTSGTAVMTAGRVLAVGAAYVLNVFLARELGPVTFGLFGVVITVVLWLELLVAEGLPLWIVRTVDTDGAGPLVPRTQVLGQVALSIGLAVALALAAPGLARVFSEPTAVLPIRVAALDIPLFAAYNLLLAVLLGSRRFGLESVATSGYALTKLAATVVLVMSGLSVLGAVIGSIAASAGGLFIALVLVGRTFRGRALVGAAPLTAGEPGLPAPLVEGTLAPPGGAISGSGVTALLLVSQSLALSADLWLVKAMLPAASAGYYRAASLVAQVPLALSSGMVWGLYAAYSAAHRRGDAARQRHYLSQTVRLLIAAGGLWTALVVPTAGALLATIFSPAYASGGPLLVTLVAGTALGLIGVALAPVLLIEGRTRQVLVAAVSLVTAEIIAAAVLAPRTGAIGVALSVSCAFALASTAALIAVKDRLAFPVLGTLARLLTPAVAVGALAFVAAPAPGLHLFVWYGILTAVFGILLFATRGVTMDDVGAVREGFR